MRRILPFLICLLVLVLAPAAQAGWFGAEAVDGPAEIDALGDVDLARDGGGGVVYLKRDGGVPQVFLSRLVEGAWTPPERLSAGLPVSEAAISATDGGRLVVTWIAGGQVLGTVIQGRGAPAPAVALSPGGGSSGLAVDMGINEAAYAVWTEAGGGGSDVRAARLEGTAWTALAAPLDIDANQPAGAGASRARMAVSAEGNAVAVWGEAGADRRNHVYGRRLTGLNLSAYPQDLTLADFEGHAGGSADSPDIDIEDDGSFAWAVFRQDIGGRSRSIARRLLGSLFEAPAAIDGGATSAAPRIDFAGKGIGAAVTAAWDNAIFSSYLDKFDAFNPGVRIDSRLSGTPPSPVVATSERGDAYAAWRTGAPDGSGAVNARRKDGEEGFEPEFAASNPSFGAVPPGQVAIGADRSGNVAVAMLQGGAGARRLTVAVYDRLPGTPVVVSRNAYRARRPLVKWAAGSENWGVQRFTLLIDGRPAGTTTRSRIVSRRAVATGRRHRFQVVATDRRGQTSRSRTYRFRVDAGRPTLSVSSGRSGRTVRVAAQARDRGPAGLRHVEIDWGDDSRAVRRRSARHRYRRSGRYAITVKATDRADNVTTRRISVRVG
jgi:hypothetical protein